MDKMVTQEELDAQAIFLAGERRRVTAQRANARIGLLANQSLPIKRPAFISRNQRENIRQEMARQQRELNRYEVEELIPAELALDIAQEDLFGGVF